MIKNYKLGDTLLKSDYDNILHKINKLEKNDNPLEEGKTVFFNKNVQTSRKEFKKQYPTNKIVHDIKLADYYIANYIDTPYFYFSSNNSRKLEGNFRIGKQIKNLNEAIDLINNPKIIYISSLNIVFKSANSELPDEMVNKIKMMLSSSDQETFQLGLTILFEYDYDLCRDKFLTIIASANHVSFWRRKKTRVIEEKLKKIKSFYPNKNF